MRQRYSIHLLLVVAVVLETVTAAQARRGIVPIGLRMTAYVNEKPEGVRPEYVWTVEHKRTKYQLYVLKVSVVRGRALPSDVDRAVRPYKVAFQVVGPASILEKLFATGPGRPVVISGDLRLSGGARTLLLGTVEDATDTPAPN